MKIKFIKVIENAGEHFIDLMEDQVGDEIVREVIVQVAEDVNIDLFGNVQDGNTPLNVAVIDQTSLTVSDTISTAGIYICPVEGLSSITLDLEEDAKVIVKAII